VSRVTSFYTLVGKTDAPKGRFFVAVVIESAPLLQYDKENKQEDSLMVEVVAALVWEGNKFMICQRPAHKARGLLWEFVGGKVEAGESCEAALIRECREELAVTLSVGEVFMDVVHEYPDITVHLTLFHAAIAEGVPQKLEHNDIRWITPAEIPYYDFCPADEEILKRIIEVYHG